MREKRRWAESVAHFQEKKKDVTDLAYNLNEESRRFRWQFCSRYGICWTLPKFAWWKEGPKENSDRTNWLPGNGVSWMYKKEWTDELIAYIFRPSLRKDPELNPLPCLRHPLQSSSVLRSGFLRRDKWPRRPSRHCPRRHRCRHRRFGWDPRSIAPALEEKIVFT